MIKSLAFLVSVPTYMYVEFSVVLDSMQFTNGKKDWHNVKQYL